MDMVVVGGNSLAQPPAYFDNCEIKEDQQKIKLKSSLTHSSKGLMCGEEDIILQNMFHIVCLTLFVAFHI